MNTINNYKKQTILCFLLITICFLQLHSQPVIHSFFPTYGPVGTVVYIKGRNFAPNAAQNIVYCGAVIAPILNATDSTLTITIPQSATYQFISVTTNYLTGNSKVPFLITFSRGDTAFSESSFNKEILVSGKSCTNQIELCDFDNDGKPDIAYTNTCSLSLSVLKNETQTDSIISYKPVLDLVSGSGFIGLTIGDINGDGKKDIAAADFVDKSVVVFKNTSSKDSISFVESKKYTAGNNPYGITMADLNGDGKPDLIATNEYDFPGTISVFINRSSKDSISFDDKLTFSVGYSPRRIITCNVNNDDKPDLAVANQGSRSVTVLVNTSNNDSISFISQDYEVTQISSPESIASGDLDGDGNMDLVVSNNNKNGTVSILKNTSSNGNGSFVFQTDLPAMKYPYSAVISDLNGDGKPDIATASHYESSSVYVYKNSSTTGISFGEPIKYSTITTHENILAGDLNGDNKPELLMGDGLYDSNVISILSNNQESDVVVEDELQLNASEINNNILLNWQMKANAEDLYFTVQRSINAAIFTDLGNVNIVLNNGLTNIYNFTDRNVNQSTANSILSYRLKKVGKTGAIKYSDTANIFHNKNELKIYPVPVEDVLNISGLDASATTHLQLINSKGIIVATQSAEKILTYKWNLKYLSKGTYYLKVTSGNLKTTIKLVK